MPNHLPDRLTRLEELAYDLWWSWNIDARRVFRNLDYSLWRQTAHNPVRMLELVSPETLARAADDHEWLSNFERSVAVARDEVGAHPLK